MQFPPYDKSAAVLCYLSYRPTLWEEESTLSSKSMQKWWPMWGEPQRICLSLPRRIRGPLLRIQSWRRLHDICVSGGTNLHCRRACEELISLICFISVGHKQEMAHENEYSVLKQDQMVSIWRLQQQLIFPPKDEQRERVFVSSSPLIECPTAYLSASLKWLSSKAFCNWMPAVIFTFHWKCYCGRTFCRGSSVCNVLEDTLEKMQYWSNCLSLTFVLFIIVCQVHYRFSQPT